MSASETLAEMRAIEQAATEGPWGTGNYWGALTHGPDGILGAYYEGGCPACDESLDAEAEVVIEGVNLDFIAAARSFVPKAIAALDAVLAMHPKATTQVITGDCAIGECDHEDECPTVDFDICGGCYNRALEVYPYFGEQSIGEVAYPCPDVAAIEQALS